MIINTLAQVKAGDLTTGRVTILVGLLAGIALAGFLLLRYISRIPSAQVQVLVAVAALIVGAAVVAYVSWKYLPYCGTCGG